MIGFLDGNSHLLRSILQFTSARSLITRVSYLLFLHLCISDALSFFLSFFCSTSGSITDDSSIPVIIESCSCAYILTQVSRIVNKIIFKYFKLVILWSVLMLRLHLPNIHTGIFLYCKPIALL